MDQKHCVMKQSHLILRHYCSICLAEMGKMMKHLSR